MEPPIFEQRQDEVPQLKPLLRSQIYCSRGSSSWEMGFWPDETAVMVDILVVSMGDSQPKNEWFMMENPINIDEMI